MLRAALVFFILAVVAFVLGVTCVAGMSMDIARILLIVFLVLTVVGIALGIIGGGRPKDVL